MKTSFRVDPHDSIFTDFYEKNYGIFVKKFTYYSHFKNLLISKTEIEDVVQDAMCSLAHHLSKQDIISNFEAYVFQSCKFRIMHINRINSKFMEYVRTADVDLFEPPADLDFGKARNIFASLFIKTINRLPEKQRQAILYYHIGMNRRAIVANYLGVSDDTIKTHIAVGRRFLTKKMKNKYYHNLLLAICRPIHT